MMDSLTGRLLGVQPTFEDLFNRVYSKLKFSESESNYSIIQEKSLYDTI